MRLKLAQRGCIEVYNQLKEYHGENAYIIAKLFETLYNTNQIQGYNIIETLEKQENSIIPSWLYDVIERNYIVDMLNENNPISLGENYVMIDDEYYNITHIIEFIERNKTNENYKHEKH